MTAVDELISLTPTLYNLFQIELLQDEILRRAVSHHGGRCWKQIGEDWGAERNYFFR